jgi:hypothetical protein
MSRRQRSGGTEGSNPVPSSGESSANLTSGRSIFHFMTSRYPAARRGQNRIARRILARLRGDGTAVAEPMQASYGWHKDRGAVRSALKELIFWRAAG